ncbi:MAG TPA: methylmalonyl-CoA mutase family protein [Chloroflexota bacterium]|nr:methylmalonyl-CoA mutase family protein [Chloroflexota bacterium]
MANERESSELDTKRARQKWEEKVAEPARRRVPERKPRFTTLSGLPVDDIYDPSNVPNDYLNDLGFPGEFPYTRGVQATMYRGRFWTMRQYAGYATAEESNRRFRYLLDQGQTGLSVAFDLPTQMGYDPDHPLAEGEVGKVGVSIASIDDMEQLLDGIPLDRVSTSMTINATAPILLALYVAVARRRGIPLERISGTVQNDILKEYTARGTYIYPPGPALRLVTDVIEFASEHLPHWNPISISGYHIREAGSTAVQELAFTLANGIAYVEQARARGLDVDRFGPRLSFFFNAHNDFFEEIAKYRAARRLWARIMRDRFGAKSAQAQMLRFHAQTAGCSLTAQQPENNVVRTTIQALAAVLGGCQSLHTNALDEALALPSEHAARLALRTQQVVAYESGVANTVDPLGGSYFVENLTSQIENEARRLLDDVDRLGGAVKALEVGYFQSQVAESAYQYQRRVENEEIVVVGVNRFADDSSEKIELLQVDPSIALSQVNRLAELKQSRDSAAVDQALNELTRAARGTENLIEPIVTCVERLCTLGEISDALRRVFSVHQERVAW